MHHTHNTFDIDIEDPGSFYHSHAMLKQAFEVHTDRVANLQLNRRDL